HPPLRTLESSATPLRTNPWSHRNRYAERGLSRRPLWTEVLIPTTQQPRAPVGADVSVCAVG
ncbi:MAG: hypothetical protein ACE5OR_06010, partial [bacterium]